MHASPSNAPLELWGGVECTVVRIGDDYRDQVVETGHRTRLEDLDAIADLGVKAVRYPIVWETVAPDSPDELDFTWHDERLERLRARGNEAAQRAYRHRQLQGRLVERPLTRNRRLQVKRPRRSRLSCVRPEPRHRCGL